MTGALKVIPGGAVAPRDDAAPDADRNNRLLTKRLRSVVDLRYDADFDHVIGAAVHPSANDEARAEALALVERSLAPASNERVAMELARLKLITAGRGLDQVDLKATLATYAEELRVYPADIVATACRRGWKWFPTAEELLDVCRPLLRSRQIIADALRRAPQDRITQAPWEPPSDDDKRYVSDLVSHLVSRWSAVFAETGEIGQDGSGTR
jgi:hypothetical protein